MLSYMARNRSGINVWPGFVDALASVLMVFIFMLLIFVVAQFFLADIAKTRFGSIEQLSDNLHGLLEEVTQEKERRTAMERELASRTNELDRTRSARDRLDSELTRSRQDVAVARERSNALSIELAEAEQRQQRAEAIVERREERIHALFEAFRGRDEALKQEREQRGETEQRLEQLDLRVAQLSNALEISNKRSQRFEAQADELGRKLNLALAERVEELNRFRSDFFGRLREVLGDQRDIQIAGDRFVFQSEVLFPSGSAELQPAGRVQLDRLATTLKSVAERIPEDVDWILRVDGHTDRRPIRTAAFPSNWELSTARALSIVRHLIERGIPARRLAATGFGEFRPLDSGGSEQAFARNRRIEMKITGP